MPPTAHVTAANTMDMPERLLPKVASRLGLGRFSFAAYTPQQIETIVSSRLEGIPAFDKTAITMVRRISSTTCDKLP